MCLPDHKIEPLFAYKNELKRKSLEENDRPRKIVATTLPILGEEANQVSDRFLESSIRMIQYYRRKNKTPVPQDPPSRDLIPHDFFLQFQHGENLLLHDDGPGVEDRIVIFAAKSGLNRIREPSRYW